MQADTTGSNYHRPIWERILDYGISILALLLLLPLILAVTVFVKLCSPGPALFKQRRVGLGGKSFMIYKFRTMHMNASTETHESHTKNLIRSNQPMTKMDANVDGRIIPFGSLLRALAIDELPQLLNVLKGEMSIVGPRPCLPSEFEEYSETDKKRIATLPGLTGFWQVSGKNQLTFAQMIDCDIQYVLRKNCHLYIYILLKTPLVLMQQAAEARNPPNNITAMQNSPPPPSFEKKAMGQ
jgi:lipopolysaccharide/colanic/teichoic acid biosynthesis glycosyltransferase